MADPDADSDRPWLTISEAAARSGRHVGALRSLVRRQRIPARKGNAGQWLVQLPVDEPLATSVADPDVARGDAMAELMAEVAELRERLARAEGEAVTAKGVAEAKVEAARDMAEARVSAARAESKAARELCDRLTAELADARRELVEAHRPWWQRLIGRAPRRPADQRELS